MNLANLIQKKVIIPPFLGFGVYSVQSSISPVASPVAIFYAIQRGAGRRDTFFRVNGAFYES